jgi:hypothetical protein
MRIPYFLFTMVNWNSLPSLVVMINPASRVNIPTSLKVRMDRIGSRIPSRHCPTKNQEEDPATQKEFILRL